MKEKGIAVPGTNDIEMEFNEETQSYYISWEFNPMVISLGKTRQEALKDLREAAHLAVDTLIDLKLRDIGREVF